VHKDVPENGDVGRTPQTEVQVTTNLPQNSADTKREEKRVEKVKPETPIHLASQSSDMYRREIYELRQKLEMVNAQNLYLQKTLAPYHASGKTFHVGDISNQQLREECTFLGKNFWSRLKGLLRAQDKAEMLKPPQFFGHQNQILREMVLPLLHFPLPAFSSISRWGSQSSSVIFDAAQRGAFQAIVTELGTGADGLWTIAEWVSHEVRQGILTDEDYKTIRESSWLTLLHEKDRNGLEGIVHLKLMMQLVKPSARIFLPTTGGQWDERYCQPAPFPCEDEWRTIDLCLWPGLRREEVVVCQASVTTKE